MTWERGEGGGAGDAREAQVDRQAHGGLVRSGVSRVLSVRAAESLILDV